MPRASPCCTARPRTRRSFEKRSRRGGENGRTRLQNPKGQGFALPFSHRPRAPAQASASPAARLQGGAPHAAAMIFTRLRARGGPFRAPARPTFAPGGKSGQKRRSNLRFEDPPAPRALRRAGCDARGWESVETARNVELRCFSERCRFCSEMQGAPFYRLGRLSNRALAADGGKCRCGPLGRVNFVGRGRCAPPHRFALRHGVPGNQQQKKEL